MKKKAETTAFAIRLPVVVVEQLDAIADAKFESRAGMVSRIVLEWVESHRELKAPTKKSK